MEKLNSQLRERIQGSRANLSLWRAGQGLPCWEQLAERMPSLEREFKASHSLKKEQGLSGLQTLESFLTTLQITWDNLNHQDDLNQEIQGFELGRGFDLITR